jgi:hypothetical protein
MNHFKLFLRELFNRRPAEMQPPGEIETEENRNRRVSQGTAGASAAASARVFIPIA